MKKISALILCLILLTAALAEGITIPDVTVKQFDIPDNEAMTFVSGIRAGWVLGNTFDAYDNGWLNKNDPLAAETYWCGAKTTEALIEELHAAGFNAIRIPVSWHDHVDENFVIEEAWLNRVKQVAQWALDRDMYVIVNVHHDNAADFGYFRRGSAGNACFYPDSDHYEQSAAYLSAIWTQMAEAFKDCDEHLMLESMNEPRLTNTSYEWYFDPNAPECLDAMDCINRLNQLFVDTVRATGGNNETRYLLVPAYDAGVEGALSDYFQLPEDPLNPETAHVVVECHAYTPYDFALNLNGTAAYSLDVQKDKSDIALFMNSLYNRYIANGIPVLIDEYGALNKENLQARVDFAAYYNASARGRGMRCFWWDNNAVRGNGELFGLIDRKTLTWVFPEIRDAIIQYSR